jgi:hypothetical protein
MGVLNKLKSRMSSYRGPTRVDPTKSSPVYGFDTGKGLAAGSNQAPIQSNTAQDIVDLGSTIGQAIGVAYGKDKKPKKDKPKKLSANKISKKRNKEAEEAGINTNVDLFVSDDASLMPDNSGYA